MILKIFPPIGIARIGDSPDEFFIGPEIPGEHAPPPGGYKTSDCRIKRQGARFRIFAFNNDGSPVLENGRPKEITAEDAAISWTVTLANTKAAAPRFYPTDGSGGLRNPTVAGADREKLKITASAVSISGVDQSAPIAPGSFRGLPVKLGDLRTDEAGRLIVLGGHGVSRKVHPDGSIWTESETPAIPYFAGFGETYDCPNWHDDVSDGTVTATVTINGQSLTALAARVIVTPPDFAPPVEASVTLYDRIGQLMIDEKIMPGPVGPISYRRSIAPILQRAMDVGRVFKFGAQTHNTVKNALADPAGIAGTSTAQMILDKIAVPDGNATLDQKKMPKLKDDDKLTGVELTATQYAAIKTWASVKAGQVDAAGNQWVDDRAEPSPPLFPTPMGLTEAALAACVGRGLRPGIEAGRFLMDPAHYDHNEPFRLLADIPAGAVTAMMAVPWQNDFASCQREGYDGWWPSHRPDIVYTEAEPDALNPPDWQIDYGATVLVEQLNRQGFVVRNKDGKLVESERSIVCRHIAVIPKRAAISRTQVEHALQVPPAGKVAGTVEDTIEVRLDGFKPSDLGITDLTMAQAAPEQFAPALVLADPGGGNFGGFTAIAVTLTPQVDAIGQLQRITFTYDLHFGDAGAFSAGGQPIERQTVTIVAQTAWKDGDKSGTSTGQGTIDLTDIPTPYIEDGPVAWLSEDLRVFRAVEGTVPIPGIDKLGGNDQGARDYLASVLEAFNDAPFAGHPFDDLPKDQQASALELYASKVGEKAVFNFAIARVRYAGKLAPAKDVRVFFRLFTTAATGLDFDPDKAYRRSPDPDAPIPLLGLDGLGHVITIPCFAAKRVDSATTPLSVQPDPRNVRTMLPPPAGESATYAYFGCWLDINQTTQQFPPQPVPPNGEWPPTAADPTGGRQSIQGLINGEHQCLVAEVGFVDQPIPLNATPGGDGRLAQRNLVWVPSDNPGGPETRTVQHSFLIKAPRANRRDDAERNELVIHRQGLPKGTQVRLYMPDIDAGEVMRLATRTMDYAGLARIDSHTLDCRPGHVSYVPIPAGRTRDAPALLTVELPEGVRAGDLHHCVIEQRSPAGDVLGAFQLNIPVGKAAKLLAPERRRLSLLRYLALGKAQDDPWRAVLMRYADQSAARVRGYGGNPDAVQPSPSGDGTVASGGVACRWLSVLFALCCALFVVAGGVYPLVPASGVAAIGLTGAALGALWVLACHPSFRRFVRAAAAGLINGAGILGLLALIGMNGPDLFYWLAASSLAGLALFWAALAVPPPPD